MYIWLGSLQKCVLWLAAWSRSLVKWGDNHLCFFDQQVVLKSPNSILVMRRIPTQSLFSYGCISTLPKNLCAILYSYEFWEDVYRPYYEISNLLLESMFGFKVYESISEEENIRPVTQEKRLKTKHYFEVNEQQRVRPEGEKDKQWRGESWTALLWISQLWWGLFK